MATTQQDLRRLAENHRANPAVSSLLTSILECELHAKMHMGIVSGAIGIASKAVNGDDGYTVMADHGEMVLNCHKAAAAMSKLSGDYMTLACVLQGLGENIDGY